MTTLFRRIKPAQKFRITKRQIAKLLGIPESVIVIYDIGYIRPLAKILILE